MLFCYTIEVKSKQAITFGTSGHRGIIGDTFTIDHVRCICAAIAEYVLAAKSSARLALGYDPRSGNCAQLSAGSFTETVVSTLTAYGVAVDVFDSVCPTPLLSWYIQTEQLDGGIMLTASHNGADYNGLKFNDATGAPANQTITASIEQHANRFWKDGCPPETQKKADFRFVNADDDFCLALKQVVESSTQSDINYAPLIVGIDSKHGSCKAIWERFFQLNPPQLLTMLHADPHPCFKGIEPNPTKYESLSLLKKTISQTHAQLGIANDPDGDRHVVLDNQGIHLLPEESTAIICDFLITSGRAVKGIVTTVASSRLVRQLCRYHDIDYVETKVGFKHFSAFLTQCRSENKLGLAVESSGGFSLSSHTLEKCGFIPALLLAQIILKTGQSLHQLRQNLYDKIGTSVFLEDECRYNEDKKELLTQDFLSLSDSDLAPFFSFSIKDISRLDGLKIMFQDDSWLLMRLSGTEPVARLYAETSTQHNSHQLLDDARVILSAYQ